MKFFRLKILAVLVLAFVSIASGQAASTSLESQAALVTELDVNGLKVLVKRRPNSQTVAAGLFFRGGARNLTPQNAGIENLLWNTATEGSKKFPRVQLRRELARTGSNISSGVNYDFGVLALASTRQSFDRSWEIFTDIALNPALTNDDLELMRQKLLTSLRDDSDAPDNYLGILQDKFIYANHPYSNNPRGNIENVSRFTKAELEAYHKSMMQTSRLLLVIVGDLDANMLRQRITDSFGKLPRGDYKPEPLKPLDFSAPTLDITPRDLPTNYIQGVFASPPPGHPDFYAMRVATTILRDRVFEEVRVKRNLSYAPSADMGSLMANSGNIYVTAVDANRAVSVMLNEIDQLKTIAVDKSDISGVTGQFLTTYFMSQETNAAQAADLARAELIGGGWRTSFDFLTRVNEVTPADVQRVSEKYMKNLRFVVLGKPEYINRQIFLQK